jgi:hypothetical protein
VFEKMSDTLIMVVTHKKYNDDFLPDKGYVSIKVGEADIDTEQLGWLTDNQGDNIAKENPWYCELTAQYWGWKNIGDNVQYIGIVHYRRFFFNYKLGSTDWKNDILTEEEIKKILKEYKIIMNYPTVKLPGKAKLYRHKKKEEQNKHWRIISDIIEKDYPEMKSVYYKFMYGNYTVWGNMFITTRDVFDEYSKWIFDVMMKYDQRIHELNEERESRVDGYLTEQLLLIYANYKFKKNQIYHLEVRNIEQDKWIDYSGSVFGKLIKLLRSNHSCLSMFRYIRIGLLRFSRSEWINKKKI